MKRLQPVIWSKGTFLSPQHLQLQDRFIESTLEFNLRTLNFRPWGFNQLKIDHEALATGNFTVLAASGLFPDGLAFDIPGSDPAPPPKPLGGYFEGETQYVDLCLAIPHHRDSGLNVSLARQSADTRYLAEVAVVRDENTGGSERPVQVARKNFRWLAATEARQGTTVLRTARVTRTSAGLYQLDAKFVPPLLDISASDYLMGMLRRLVEIIAAKSSGLAGLRRHKNESLAEFTASDIPNFWLLYTVNSYLPLFRHLLESRKGHPERLFDAMLTLAGALTTFHLKLHPRDLPAYDHEDLGACFTDLDEKLRHLLETAIKSNFVSLPLTLVRPNIYAAALADDRYFNNTRMYLALQAEMGEAELISKAPHLIKVCSANHIDQLVRQALPGMLLTHLPRPPAALPIKLNYQYFSLSQGGVVWEAITRARNLAAYVPGDFPHPQLELIILLPQSA
jgi:type VI secretion system protein ImpJ